MPVRVHLVQLDIAWENAEANFTGVDRLLEGADVQWGDLIVLPELFDSGFSLNADRTADNSGTTMNYLTGLATRTGATVHGSRTLLPDPAKRALNTVCVTVPNSTEPVSQYAKMHPFTFGREPERFRGGDALDSYEWAGLRVCPAICYDLRFPELFRAGLQSGAEAFAIGANWPDARQEHWRTLIRARAIENQAFVFAVNRCGSDPHLSYAGGSAVIDPKGECLGELGPEQAVLSVEIDPETLHDWRRSFPAWKDARLGVATEAKPATE